jgi:hypothetical protein
MKLLIQTLFERSNISQLRYLNFSSVLFKFINVNKSNASYLYLWKLQQINDAQ